MNHRYVLVRRFCEITGYTDKAVRRKIEEGVWLENRHYRRAPDGNVLVDVEAVQDIEALEADRAFLRKLGYPVPTSPRLEPAQDPTVDVAPTCGVYLLTLDEAVVYVGRSTNLRSRLRTHRKSGRQFTDVRLIPCDEATSLWLEKDLIRTLRPAQNLVRYERHARITERTLRRGGLH